MASTDLPRRWAVLIGIDFYSHGNARRDLDVSYHTLRGCVSDINAVENFITSTLSVKKECIRKLTASAPEDIRQNEPEEDIDTIPTYENMVRAIKSVTDGANAGDLVYIHYSGHGAKVATIFPGIKGSGGIDEALVSTDICTGGRYLRDMDLASLLADMVHKRLIVTVVLDCCHSGSMGPEGALCRGIAKIDDTILPSDMSSGIPQDVPLQKKQSWLLEPEGYDLFAACCQNGKAYENTYLDTRGKWHGALTYWMLDALNAGGSTTNRILYQKIHDNIRIRHPQTEYSEPQVPLFAGNAERHFFHTLSVQQVGGDFVSLNAGQAHTGTEYTKDTQVFNGSNQLAPALVTEVIDRESKAQFVKHHSAQWQNVGPGGRARSFYQRLILIHAPLKKDYRTPQKEAMYRLYTLDWDMFSSGIARLVLERSVNSGTSNSGDNDFDIFSVMVDDIGMYELWTGHGAAMRPIPNFVPCSIPRIFIDRVAHLAEFQVIKNLKGPDNTSLSGKLSFRVKDHLFDGSYEETVEVQDGEEITIIFENNSDKAVYLTIFNLQPLYGITKIYPDVIDYEKIDPYDKRELQLEVTRPPGVASSTTVDTIKAFVTLDRTSFRAMEMEDIDINPDTESPAVRPGNSDLQSLLDHLSTPDYVGPQQASSTGVWETKEISVRMRDFEHMEGVEETKQKIIDHLDTVIATGRSDFEISFPSNTAIYDKIKDRAQTVFNVWTPQCVQRSTDTQHSPKQRNVRWRCRCGKGFTGVIPADLAERYRRHQQGSRTTTQSTGGNPSSHIPQLPSAQKTTGSVKRDIGMRTTEMSGSFIYLCVDKTSFSGRHMVLGLVSLPIYDDELFQRLQTMYSELSGSRSMRKVSSFKLIKFQRSHTGYKTKELTAEGYSYYSSTQPLREDEMLHFFHNPQCIQGSTECLRRIPKTSEQDIDPSHGWGLFVRESYSVTSILIPLATLSSLIIAYIAFYLLHVPLYDTWWHGVVLASPT